MNVLITGGAGYVGNELVYELCRNREVKKIIIYDNLSRRNYNLFLDARIANCNKLHFINDDIIDILEHKDRLDDVDVVYHLAGRASTGISRGNLYLHEQVNHWGTMELVQALEGSQVKKLVYLSSASIYGYSDQPIDINSQANPVSLYAKSKLAGEKLVEKLASKMDVFIIRPANVYGYSPGIRFEPLINRLMFEACYVGNFSIRGNPQQVRSFVPIEKLINVLSNMILINFPPGVYNLVDMRLSPGNIVSEFKNIFPNMAVAMSEINAPINHRMVLDDNRLQPLISLPAVSLKDSLVQFREKLLQAHTTLRKAAV
jgi:UDP-glucose 4-epimerase